MTFGGALNDLFLKFKKINFRDKNTILTTIGITTIGVCVVGATYAYFSVTGGGSVSSALSGGVEKTGTVTLEEVDDLNIKLLASDMSKANAGSTGKTYWFTTDANGTGSNYLLDETNQKATANVAKITLSGGDTGVDYYCTAKLNIAGEDDLEEGVSKITLTGDSTSGHQVLFGSSSTLEVDLSEGVTNKTVKINLSKASSSDLVEYITAKAYYKNLTTAQSEVSFTTNVSLTDLSCDTKASNDTTITPLDIITNKKGTGGLSSNLTGDMYRYQGSEGENCTYANGSKQTPYCGVGTTKIVELLNEDNYRIYSDSMDEYAESYCAANYIEENNLLSCNILDYSSCQEYSGTKLEDEPTCHYDNDYEIEDVDGNCEDIFDLDGDIYTKSEVIEEILDSRITLKSSAYQNISNNLTDEDICDYYYNSDDYAGEFIACNVYNDVTISNREVNNYICIGSNSCQTSIMSEQQYDDNTYRIIGITEYGRMKVIKMGLSNLGDNSSNSLEWYWNGTGSGETYDWTNATIRKRLNNPDSGYYLASLGEYASYIDSSSNSKFYSTATRGISSPAYIEWDSINQSATNLYALETGETIASYGANEVDNEGYGYKVGLMQLSDYYLAAGDNVNCYFEEFFCEHSWIYFQDEWTIARESAEDVWNVFGDGNVFYAELDYNYGIRPVFYLKSDIQLKGNGTKESPYYIVTD